MADKVFSVTDFKEGLDVRKTPLTGPGGSLRILENAVLNQGGEIEKRLAFVKMTTISPTAFLWVQGHRDSLHAFQVSPSAASAPGGSLPVPIVVHTLQAAPEQIVRILDAEPYGEYFYVCGQGASGQTYCWYADVLVHEVDSSISHGTYARTWKSKMYRCDGGYLRFSGVNNPAQNDPSSTTEPGAGFINVTLNDPDVEPLVGMEVYYNNMATQARLQTQIWSLDPDPDKDNLTQLLRIGTVAAHSVVQFGTGDVLFLSDSGVRSLKALYINLAASVSDVGSSIDPLLTPVIRTKPTAAQYARSVVQPIQGRYWLAIDTTIYVLSYFVAGSITAWSTFDPGFSVANFAVVGNRVYAYDSTGAIYLYGGLGGNDYDNCLVTVRTPHMTASEPTMNKRIKSMDVMCEGAWSISIGMLASNTDQFEPIANVQDNTFDLQSIPFAGYGTHFAVHLENQAPGPALLAALHFNIQEAAVK